MLPASCACGPHGWRRRRCGCRRGCTRGMPKSHSASRASVPRLAGLELHLGQREAAVAALLRRGVEGEDEVLAIGRDVEVVGARARRGRVRTPLPSNRSRTLARALGLQFQQVQVRHPPHRQVVIPVAVLRLAGGVATFLALAEGLVRLGLRRVALELRPDPGDEDDAACRPGTSGRRRRRWPPRPRGAPRRRRVRSGTAARSRPCAPCCSRLAVKAIRGRRAGDQRGAPSFSPQVVSARGLPPSVDSSHSDEAALLSSIE